MIDNAEDLDYVMPMYNLLEYSENYPMKSGSSCIYYIDEINDDANENNDACNYSINNNKITTTKSFTNKTKIIGSTQAKKYYIRQRSCRSIKIFE